MGTLKFPQPPAFGGLGGFWGSRGSGPRLQGGAPTLCSPALVAGGSIFVSKPGSILLSVKGLECYIYSKLILIVLGWKILWKISQGLFLAEGKAMSYYKAFKTFISVKIVEVRNIFLNGQGNIEEFMKNFYALSRKHHILEKKQNNSTSHELLLLCVTD